MVEVAEFEKRIALLVKLEYWAIFGDAGSEI
jgi:hypothetical protein